LTFYYISRENERGFLMNATKGQVNAKEGCMNRIPHKVCKSLRRQHSRPLKQLIKILKQPARDHTTALHHNNSICINAL